MQTTFSQIIEQVPYLPEELQIAVANLEDPAELAHMIAGSLRIKTEERQELLEERDLERRLRRLSELLARELGADLDRARKIQSQVESEMEQGQREFFLRQQLKAIQEELGEVDEQEAEAQELREQVEAAELPEHAQKQAERELDRFERLPPQAAEHGVIRTYLEWIATLPWSKGTEDHLDLKAARKILDDDHYDMEKVKDRILEFLAVRKLKPDARALDPVLRGPARAWARPRWASRSPRAMGREFERISVGGVRDESEIRGHRRTYIGAMPGTILRAMRDAGSNNPVLMIDEIDKMGADFRGDPSSAMLEVLDPEQNATFRDHYLDLPFDLSKVFFITTANQLDPVPPPLRDRMEIDRARRATPRRRSSRSPSATSCRARSSENGLGKSKIEFTDDGAARDHRGLHARGRRAQPRARDRPVGRKVAREFAEGTRRSKRTVGPKAVARAARPEALPARRGAAHRRARRGHGPGVDARGRRRAVRGGHLVPGGGQAAGHRPARRRDEGVRRRGALLREAQRATLGRARARGLVSRATTFTCTFPPGRSPRTARAPGITIATALASLVSGRPVRSDTAMTGEITLTGQVLPIGGLKEKALAAQRAEISRVIAPGRNEPDAAEFPPNLLKSMEFLFVETVDEVLAAALEPEGGLGSRRRRSGVRRPSRDRVAASTAPRAAKT